MATVMPNGMASVRKSETKTRSRAMAFWAAGERRMVSPMNWKGFGAGRMQTMNPMRKEMTTPFFRFQNFPRLSLNVGPLGLASGCSPGDAEIASPLSWFP